MRRWEMLVNLKGRDHLVDQRVNEKLILKQIRNKWDVIMWTGFNWYRKEFVVGSCEHGYED
jgi:hypothetical protein